MGFVPYKKKVFLILLRKKILICCVFRKPKAHKDQLDPILFSPTPDYSSYWSSASRKGYSGVVTYSKTEPLKVEHGIGIEKFDSEGRFIVTHFADFILYNVYFPNGAARLERHDYKQEFLQIFQQHLAQKLRSGKKVILVGDYNIAHKEIDIYDPVRLAKTSGFLPEERRWFDGFLESGFVDTFRYKNPTAKERYSWWSYQELARPANRGWRIDYVCVSENLKSHIQKADILDQQHGSDHCPVVLKM